MKMILNAPHLCWSYTLHHKVVMTLSSSTVFFLDLSAAKTQGCWRRSRFGSAAF